MATYTAQQNGLRRQRHGKRRLQITVLLLALVILAFACTLLLGRSYTPPGDVLRILLGEQVAGASFTVGQLRLPRAILALLAGASFGMAGTAFQVMLRNPLASPDIIGISSGASAAAVFAIIILGLNGVVVSLLAVVCGLATALVVYGLASRQGVAGARLILVGIAVSAMLESVVAYVLARAPAWNLQEALRWLTGSLNGATLEQSLPLLLALVVLGGVLASLGRNLEALKLGDDAAAALGVQVAGTRVAVILCAVGLISIATAVTGPIAFVAFLSGPIAQKIMDGTRSNLLPAALVGALLVLVGDFVGQVLLPSRYPVGVVTGALGAPYLIYLIIRVNRSGAAA
ncbi:ABC transporter permease [Rhizobium sp. Root274]|uniref:FecCD family ABC transporter permease n=1 Tax=unclassified Rhizobium TaxID=2613769 RepID=UPI00071411D2|nr:MULTISPECIES: iron ABC transporter permease [unclassified Rhizobium]KQW27911.1 ABC transporter permease [Rhizobium sp. Root1240]KRD28191.1 ABC transporter permease [Rhizobium sp. Root274]